jgi:hypothetical protein
MHFPSLRVGAVMVFLAVCVATTAAHAESLSDAQMLVLLRKPLEREAQVIRFMLAVSPFEGSSGYAECTIRNSEAPMRRYFETLYATLLNQEELRKAVSFFGSKEGQEVIRLKVQHEQNIFNAARDGVLTSETPPPYPAAIRAALDAFERTSAGRFFSGEDLETREPFRSEVEKLRSAALTDCFAAGGK